MDPKVNNIDENNNTLTFTLYNTNVSIANAVRRIILSEIPCVVFKTIPYENSKVTIEINTTKFNNEIIKQRLSCIPIHIDDMDFPIDDYIVELDKSNDTNSAEYITTEDFKIKNIKLNNYLKEATVRKIFPKNDMTNYYIDFIPLNPKLSDNINGEQLKLSCKLAIGTAKEQGMFNVVSTCSYKFTQDTGLMQIEWDKQETQLIKNGKIKEEIAFIKKDWLLLDAKRLYIKDSFDFIIETVGIYENFKLVVIACDVLIKKLNMLNIVLKTSYSLINESDNTMDNCYDITLENEDYTIGKVLEYILYKKYFTEKQILTYCGFLKQHPHNNYSTIRLAFKNIVENADITAILSDVIQSASEIFTKIKNNFTME